MIEDNKGIVYDKSPIPSAKPGGIATERNPDRGIGADDSGKLTYESAASSGHTEVVLPALPGSPNGEERLLARDFGAHVAGKIESSITRNPYLKSGPQQSPAQVFAHYTAVARGASLMDEGALKRMEQLGVEFRQEPEQEEFFAQVIRPYLLSLSPQRRQP
jgi:hypothetical protein